MEQFNRASALTHEGEVSSISAPLVDNPIVFSIGLWPMTRSQQPALTAFAIGMVGLGILALIYGDFALVWQPVAPWIPGRTVLAYGSGLIMLLGGVGLLFRATAAWSARILFPYLIAWLLLKVPALLVAPQMEAVW